MTPFEILILAWPIWLSIIGPIPMCFLLDALARADDRKTFRRSIERWREYMAECERLQVETE